MSHAPQVPEVSVHLAPLQSLLQRTLLLHVEVASPSVHIVQGANFSWLGYPADTDPSSRNWLPGLPPQVGYFGQVHAEHVDMWKVLIARCDT